VVYDLVAVVSHHGADFKHGHYTAECLDWNSGAWQRAVLAELLAGRQRGHVGRLDGIEHTDIVLA